MKTSDFSAIAKEQRKRIEEEAASARTARQRIEAEQRRLFAIYDPVVKRHLHAVGAAVFGNGFLGMRRFRLESHFRDKRSQYSCSAGYWQLHGPQSVTLEVNLIPTNDFEEGFGFILKLHCKWRENGGRVIPGSEVLLINALGEITKYWVDRIEGRPE